MKQEQYERAQMVKSKLHRVREVLRTIDTSATLDLTVLSSEVRDNVRVDAKVDLQQSAGELEREFDGI